MAAITTGVVAAGAGIYGAKRDRDAANAATAASAEARDESLAYIKEATDTARNDIFELFPSAQESRQSGIGASMDFLKEALPVQIDTFQQGNVGAQEVLANALPQIQNALLGSPVVYDQFQPQRIDTSGISRLLESAQVPEVERLNPEVTSNLFRDPNAEPANTPAVPGIGQNYQPWMNYQNYGRWF